MDADTATGKIDIEIANPSISRAFKHLLQFIEVRKPQSAHNVARGLVATGSEHGDYLSEHFVEFGLFVIHARNLDIPSRERPVSQRAVQLFVNSIPEAAGAVYCIILSAASS